MSFIDMMANSLLENSNLVWTTASNGASHPKGSLLTLLYLVRRSEFGLAGEAEEGFMLCNSFIIAGLPVLQAFPVLSAHVIHAQVFLRVCRRDLIYDLVLFQITGVNGVRHHLKASGMT